MNKSHSSPNSLSNTCPVNDATLCQVPLAVLQDYRKLGITFKITYGGDRATCCNNPRKDKIT